MPNRIWEMPKTEKKLYLSFDDGPHPIITNWVLDQLKAYDAKATFFCIGKNVKSYPEVYARILKEGHRVGNHTFHHLKASVTPNSEYLQDIQQAAALIDSDLFRPPYGSINGFLIKRLNSEAFRMKTIMWTVISGDFDQGISKERCLNNVLVHSKNGAIVVFHDSEKAEERMRYALPIVLKYYYEKGFTFARLP